MHLTVQAIRRLHYASDRPVADKEFPLVHYLTRPISFYPTALCLRAGISANFITCASTVLAIVGIGLLVLREDLATYAGASLLFLWVISDSIDGNVARLTNTGSPYGAFLDYACGTIVATASFLGAGLVAIGYQTPLQALWKVVPPQHARTAIIILSATACISYLLASLFAVAQKHEAGKAKLVASSARPRVALPLNVAKNLSAFINILTLLTVLAVAEMLDYFLLFYAFWNPLAALYVLWRGRRRLRS